MTVRTIPIPRSETLWTAQTGLEGDAGRADAVAILNYTTSASASIPKSPCPRLITWLRCRACHRGYVSAGAPGPHACPACTGGRLQPVALWDLACEAAPQGMVRFPVAQEGRA